MANSVFNFNDNGNKVSVKLYANPFGTSRYYGAVKRDTVTLENIIARLNEADTGINRYMILNVAGLIRSEMIAALKRGQAVNLLDMCTMYLAAGSTANTAGAEAGVVPKLTVKCTPAKEISGIVSAIEVSDMTVADTSPAISTITDMFTRTAGTVLSKGKSVRIDGRRLKIAGERGGIYLCPEGEPDESKWLCIGADALIRNQPKALEFYLPEDAPVGTPFRFLVRTSYCQSQQLLKTPIEVQSEVCIIQE